MRRTEVIQVAFDRNLFEIPPSEISDAKVELTLFGGKTVFQKEEE